MYSLHDFSLHAFVIALHDEKKSIMYGLKICSTIEKYWTKIGSPTFRVQWKMEKEKKGSVAHSWVQLTHGKIWILLNTISVAPQWELVCVQPSWLESSSIMQQNRFRSFATRLSSAFVASAFYHVCSIDLRKSYIQECMENENWHRISLPLFMGRDLNSQYLRYPWSSNFALPCEKPS